ncbi:MAG: carboxypeptidase regulatory-like domain-containing protein, partial [Acidobacteria bacterium]|nr:carboxypeptidase regulatory-like domain-containing protein [Acidobacteriota bacterium]
MRERLFFPVLLLLGALPAFSQIAATLTGNVSDSSGGSVAGAQVTLTNTDTGARREAVSNESGLYQFPLLQPAPIVSPRRRRGSSRSRGRPSVLRSTKRRASTSRFRSAASARRSKSVPLRHCLNPQRPRSV